MFEFLKTAFLNEALTFIIGTLIIGGLFELIRRGVSHLLSRKYENWKLAVIPKDGRSPYESKLLCREVVAFSESSFER